MFKEANQSYRAKILFSVLFYVLVLVALNLTLFTGKNLQRFKARVLKTHSENNSHVSPRISMKLPPQLETLPFADDIGIIKVVSDICIPKVPNPYNPGLVAKDDGFLLFFRHDDSCYKEFEKFTMTIQSGIGCVKLNRRFSPVSDPVFLKTGSKFCDDPRAFKKNGDVYLVYNELFPAQESTRIMKMALINLETYQPQTTWHLKQSIQRIEKNWVPVVSDENELHFIYSISPPKTMKVSNNETMELDFLASDLVDQISCNLWKQKWGALRGGTPTVLIDGEYFAFFHSQFIDENHVGWYVMGACTFSSSPPYQITSISDFPLLFNNMYMSKHSSLANPNLRCIYPTGVEVEKIDGKTFVYVACGENDSAVKIITIDYEKLRESMSPVL